MIKKLVLILITNLLLWSCARVGSPVGGSKDTIPPQYMGSNIDSPRVNVSTNLRELRIDFDEYIQLKNIQKQLIISPPIKNLKKIIPSNLANKYILIQWGDSLQRNTTYNFNFGNAIVDYNEGNVLPYFNFAFSTGSHLDSLYLSGTAKAVLSNQNDKEANIIIGLYPYKDSINYREKPYYITKADKDGYYELDYLAVGHYKLIAFNDENGNSVYDTGKEALGFIKDFINLKQSISGLNLNLYPAKKKLEHKDLKTTNGGILMTFEGNPKKVEVKSISSELSDYKITHTPYSDSLTIWFDAAKEGFSPEKGTLLKFSYDLGSKKDTVQTFYKPITKDELTLKNNYGGVLKPQQPLVITSNYAIDKIDAQYWKLTADSMQVAFNFEAKISKDSPYKIEVSAPYEADKNYRLIIPKSTVLSYYQSNAKPYAFDFKVDAAHNYGTLTIRLAHAPKMPFWVQLLDKDYKTINSIKTQKSEIKFSELKPSNYHIQILVDDNDNGVWDTANLSTNTLAEGYYLYPKTLEVRQLWDLVEDWDLAPNTDTAKATPISDSTEQQSPSLKLSLPLKKETTTNE